jgi:hydroxymethylpyrimidine pyrophosphatase-like HAD family hydrolase
MLNKKIPKKELDKTQLLILDSDGVCVKRGTKITEKIDKNNYELRIKTNVVSDEIADKIRRLSGRFKIAICSGRSLMYLKTIYHKVIDCVVFIAENGAIEYDQGIIRHREFSLYSTSVLNKIKREVLESKIPISGFEPKNVILTIHAKKEFKEIYDIVKKEDRLGALKVMWNGEAFDIQPLYLSKAIGIKRLNYEKQGVIAIGDRINDKEMIESADIPISADIDRLKAPYWTIGKKLPGEQLLDYLLKVYEK